MNDTHTPRPRSGLVTGSRWALTILAGLLALGAFTQFFLVGVSFFDDAGRWSTHAAFGSTLGILTYVMWIPAVLGKTGRGVIISTISLFILFGMQHAFIEAGGSMVSSLHALNGTFVLVMACWITQQAARSIRQPVSARSDVADPAALPDNLERSTS